MTSEPTTHSQLKLPNKVPRLLLLSMFTIAARYSGSQPQVPEGNMWEAGCDFLETAKMILSETLSRGATSMLTAHRLDI